MAARQTFQIELFGVPRMLSGQGAVSVRTQGSTLGDIAAALGRAYPALLGSVIDRRTGWLLGGYTFVVNDEVITAPEHEVAPTTAIQLSSSTSEP